MLFFLSNEKFSSLKLLQLSKSEEIQMNAKYLIVRCAVLFIKSVLCFFKLTVIITNKIVLSKTYSKKRLLNRIAC
jgi:hypothetical protein